MNFSKAPSTVPKGHLRCFQCRQTCLMKNGDWHNRDNQQVFLCKGCDKAQLDTERNLEGVVKGRP